MVLVVINNFLTCQVLPHLTEIGESSARGEDTDERVLEQYYDLAMVLDMLTDYLSFIVKIRDQTRLVFADEKPQKEKDLLFKVRRDPFTGNVPHHSCNANSKNRYNIFAAVAVNRNGRRNVEFLVIMEETGDAYLFREFVLHLIEVGTLVEKDIFVVDNCSIHTKGENTDLQDLLWREYKILLMVPLPPYHPELNPPEFVFHHLVETLRAEYARYGCNSELEFRFVLELTINQLGLAIVWKMFLKNIVIHLVCPKT